MKLLLFALLLVLAPLAVPQAISPPNIAEFDQRTGLPNGRIWSAMSNDARHAWLLGFKNGIFVVEAMGHSKDRPNPIEKVLDTFFSSNLTLGEEIQGINRFYGDTPENMPIPIVHALQYVVAKAHGATQMDLDALASGWRKTASE